MFSLSSSAITTAVSEGSKETKILFCAMQILADKPDIKTAYLVNELNCRASELIGNQKLSYPGVEHYYCCAQMYLHLYNVHQGRTVS